VLDPRRLRLLVELSERGTISAVAEALHFTPSTVSHGLATLEQEVGVPLLERGPHSVALTPAGESLARDGRLLLAGLSAARADARALSDSAGDAVTIATFVSAGATLVADALGEMPLTVNLVDAEPLEAMDLLAAGDVDIAVAYRYEHVPQLALDGLEVTPLLEDPVLACLPAGHPALDHDPTKLAHLRDERFIAGRPGSLCHAMTHEACRIAGFEPNVTFETSDSTFMCALVDAGAGVALMPALLVTTAARAVTTRAPQPAPSPRRIFAVHRSKAPRMPSIHKAVDALRTAGQHWQAALDVPPAAHTPA
jgi:DNA-binding transcriptional LysR family regulator